VEIKVHSCNGGRCHIDFLTENPSIRKLLVVHVVNGFDKHTAGSTGWVYQDVFFDTKKKALPGVEVPKRAKTKGFPQIFGLLEALFLY